MSGLQQSTDHPLAIDAMVAQAERIAAGYAPAYVVVDEADEVVLFSRGTGRFLDPAGAATLHLPSLVDPRIATAVSSLMRWTRVTGSARRTDGLASQGGALTVAVEPLPAAPGRLMVLFQLSHIRPVSREPDAVEQAGVCQLDLTRLREEVQSLREELAFSNEEYQTSTEELEASNEELAAAGEESRTINEELAARVAELDQANSDIRHMLRSTRIAILFLDGALRIRSFTPATRELFHLIDQDVGRPLADITAEIAYPELADDVGQVLLTQGTVEREVDDLGGRRRYLVRLLPDHGATVLAMGVVLAFVDITAAHQANRARQESEDRLHCMAASVPAFLFIARPELGWDYVNPPFAAFTGMREADALGEGWLAAVHPDDLAVARHVEVKSDRELRIRRADGAWHWFLLRAVPQTDDAGRLLRWFGSCTDIDQRRQVELRQGRMLAERQHRVKNVLALVRSLLVRTVKSSTDLQHFVDHFTGRIGALARSQTAAARTLDQRVMLDELVSEELGAHGAQDERKTNLEGPEVELSEKMAGAIGLAIHELTTNALKYGALSTPAGQVDVRWRLEPAQRPDGLEADRLILDWLETGVPLTDLNPSRRGFGRELIEQAIPYELGADTTLRFQPGGVHCRIALPLRERRSGAAA